MRQIIIEKGKKIKASFLYKKDKVKNNFFSEKTFIIILIILISILSFLLGELNMYYKLNKETEEKILINKNIYTEKKEYKVLASKKGTRYYYPWCQSAYKIKETNLIEFKNKTEAEKNGLSLARGCEAPVE